MNLDEIVNKRISWLPSLANHIVNGTRAVFGYTNACANTEVLLEHKDKSIIFASIHRTWDDSVALWDILDRYRAKPVYGLMRDTLFKTKYFDFSIAIYISTNLCRIIWFSNIDFPNCILFFT